MLIKLELIIIYVGSSLLTATIAEPWLTLIFMTLHFTSK